MVALKEREIDKIIKIQKVCMCVYFFINEEILF